MSRTRYLAFGLLFCASVLFLSSLAGVGASASPILLILLYLAARATPNLLLRFMWALPGALAAAEGVWGLMYVTAGEVQPWIWLLPALGALLASAALVFVSGDRSLRHL